MPNDAGTMAREAGKEAAGDAGHLDLDRFLPYRLSILSNKVSDSIARLYSQRFGLSVPEWRIMAVLGQMPGLSAGDVARRTAMDKVQVSRAVAALVGTRRVQRDGDESDGRVTRLSLTARGRANYDEIVPLALHLEAVLLGALSREERESLNRLLDKLARQVDSLESV
ncbi:MAG TPA: MarR family winged helix-turn-helix transcriptional regulator [Rhizomicrobium sp.]|nr:MarR family winged helix-turn-helix transcriptional regulator [Rhizomicrobium sp.]